MGIKRKQHSAEFKARVAMAALLWLKSTHNGRSLRLTLSICLPLLFEIQ